MCTRIKGDEELKESMQAFLEIGNERNKLVHQNYAAFPMEKTLEEIYKLYQCAFKFVEHFSQALRECDKVF